MGDWKLLLNAGGANDEGGEQARAGKKARGKGKKRAGGEGVELYNLAADIGEKNNLAVEQPDKVKELRARLDQWMKSAVPAGNAGIEAGAATPKRGKKK
jgi:hypothetical protein